MPTFEFTSPEGKKYSVDGPPGATKEQAFAILQQHLGTNTPSDQGTQNVPRVDASGHYVPDQKPAAPADPSLVDRLIGGGETALSLATGATGGTLGMLGGAVKGLYNAATNGTLGTQQGVQQIEQAAGQGASALTYQPRTQLGQEYTQNVGEAMNAALPLAMAPEAAVIAQAGRPVANQVAAATRAPEAVQAASNAARAAGAKVGKAAKAVVPTVDETTANLAAKAQNQYGIPLRPDQLYDNKIAKMIGEASEKVPLSGSQAAARQEAFNKAVISTIGGDADATKLTPDVFRKAINTSGQKIGDIAAKTDIPFTDDFKSTLDNHIANVDKFETGDVQKIVTNYINEIKVKGRDGVIPGEAFRKINTSINNKMRSTSNGDLRHALGELQDDLHDYLQQNLSGDDLAALRDARQKYAIAKAIEPLVAKSPTGDISPAGLMARVTADNAGKARMARGNGGEIGDLARIGQRFLKEPASSGTAERGLAYGIAGGGVVAEPTTAATIYGLSNIYNRTGAKVARKLTPRK